MEDEQQVSIELTHDEAMNLRLDCLSTACVEVAYRIQDLCSHSLTIEHRLDFERECYTTIIRHGDSGEAFYFRDDGMSAISLYFASSWINTVHKYEEGHTHVTY